MTHLLKAEGGRSRLTELSPLAQVNPVDGDSWVGSSYTDEQWRGGDDRPFLRSLFAQMHSGEFGAHTTTHDLLHGSRAAADHPVDLHRLLPTHRISWVFQAGSGPAS